MCLYKLTEKFTQHIKLYSKHEPEDLYRIYIDYIMNTCTIFFYNYHAIPWEFLENDCLFTP